MILRKIIHCDARSMRAASASSPGSVGKGPRVQAMGAFRWSLAPVVSYPRLRRSKTGASRAAHNRRPSTPLSPVPPLLSVTPF
jgi:hypothetical protein